MQAMKAVRKLMESADNERMGHWRVYIDYFELDARSRQLSPFTIKVNGERLALLARWLEQQQIDVDAVTRDDIQQYLLSIYRKVSDETVAGRIRTYKRFWNVLIEGGVWHRPHPLDGIKKPRLSRKLRKTISPAEFDLILSVCSKRTFLGYRNYAMLHLMWDCMLRRGEVAGLKVEDIDFASCTIRVLGKGKKIRLVPMGAKTAKSLHYFLNRWRASLPGRSVFCTNRGTPLALVHVHQVCSRTARKAGLAIGCHIIRHSAATEFLRCGGQLGILSKVLGHADISTTSIYTHLTVDDAVKSYEQYSPANSLHV
jgi:integrase/recombinase XerD